MTGADTHRHQRQQKSGWLSQKERQDRMASTQDGGIESAQQTQAGPPKTDEQHMTSTAI